MAAPARIEIERDRGGRVDKWRAYKVMLDGTEAARLKRGERRTIDAEPGHHEVHLAVDWCRSRSVSFDLEAGHVVRLRCRPNSRPMLQLFRITVGAADYIGLELVDDAGAN